MEEKNFDVGLRPEQLLRVPQVLARLGISKSTWWRGIQEGRYPSGLRISKRAVGWPVSQIDQLIDSMPERGGAL